VLDAAAVIARDAGDVVARALVARVARMVVERDPALDHDHLGPGWVRVVDALAATVAPTTGGAVAEPA